MFEGINRTFGSEVWSRVLIGLTKSELRAPPPGVTYGKFNGQIGAHCNQGFLFITPGVA